MSNASCPECGSEVTVEGKPKKGQRVVCFNCNADLEVVNVSPLELDWAYYEEPDEDDELWEEEEVWDDEEEEELWGGDDEEF